MRPLEGRVALVTGGSRGVGRGIATRLAAAGATVAANFRRDGEAADATIAAIRAEGGDASAHQASVDSIEGCRRLVDEVLSTHGKVDILVNNGGVASRGLPVADTDPEEVERLFATHALGPFVLCKLLIPQMRELERGDIIMVSSTTALTCPANASPYTMAKAALETLARTLAAEEQPHGIRVNVVAPGLVATDMGDRLARALTHGEACNASDLAASAPFGRVCQPSDVAAAVAFLVSADASYVTGTRLVIDGGGDPAFGS